MSWSDNLCQIVNLTQRFESMNSIALGVKLSEEVGELSEVILHRAGFLDHKEAPKETVFGEGADVINVVLGILATNYPYMSPEQIVDTLLENIQIKGDKYKTKILKVHE